MLTSKHPGTLGPRWRGPGSPLRLRDLTAAQREAVEIEEYARIRRQMPVLYLSIALCAVATLISAQGDFPSFYQQAVQALVIAFCLVRSAQWYAKRNEQVTADIARRRCLTTIVLAVILIVPLLFWSIDAFYQTHPIARAIVPMFLTLGCFGASNCLASHPPAAITPLLVGVLPLSALLLLSGETHAMGVGLAIITVLILKIRLILAGHAEMVSAICLRMELETQARTDPLTGLPNRRALNEQLGARIVRAVPDPFTLVLLDLDGFKPVNDRHGHLIGDALLAAIAQRLSVAAAPGILVSRLGGDEFALLIDGPDREAAQTAETLLASLALPFLIGGHRIAIGASMGLAAHPADGQTSEALLEAADKALYRAKAQDPAAEAVRIRNSQVA